MLVPTGSIKLGRYTFQRWESVNIQSSYEALTDTVHVRVPRRVQFDGKRVADGESLFNVGEKASISLGYDHLHSPVFDGFITRIYPCDQDAGIIAFDLQDSMYSLKKVKAPKKAYTNVSLQTLLTDILPAGTQFQADDITLGSIRIEEATVAAVLNTLRTDYNLYCWFRDGVLHVGLAYSLPPTQPRKGIFRFGHNIVDASSLSFANEEDITLQVIVWSDAKGPDGKTKVTEAKAGQEGGDTLRFQRPGMPLADMQELANHLLRQRKYSGYTGTFATLAKPVLRHGDLAVIQDPIGKRPTGTYRIAGVVLVADAGGLFQHITLGPKIA